MAEGGVKRGGDVERHRGWCGGAGGGHERSE